MNKFTPIIALFFIIFAGLYIWMQKEDYDPYSVREIDKMLSQAPTWLEKENQDSTINEEKIEDIILNSEIDGEVEVLKITESSDKEVVPESEEEDSQKKWNLEIIRFFEKDLKLKENLISSYKNLKRSFYTEKEKFGESNAIQDKYSEKIRLIFGGENYIRYIQYKHHFNERFNTEIEL